MPDVAFILPDFRCGGAEKVALCVIEYLVSRGHSVDLVLTQGRGELLDSLPPEVRVFDLGARRIRNAVAPLVRYLKSERPKAIQASMWPITVIAVAANRLARGTSKVVVSNHAILSAEYPFMRQRAAIGSTTRLFYPLADTRVAVSPGTAEDVASLSGLSPSIFEIVHNPIDLPPRVERDRGLTSVWGGAALRILTVGRLKPIKDHTLLIRAMARVPAEADARLVIAGTGEMEEELKRLARSEGVEDRINFVGFTDDPWPLYASADVFALTSREESFGNVLVEALHAGLPIVSTPTVGGREVLADGQYGRLIEDPTPESLAKALVETAADQRDEEKLKARARELSGVEALQRYEAILCG